MKIVSFMILTLLSLACASPSTAAPENSPNSKFVTAAVIIGLNEEQLKEQLGSPMVVLPNECKIPTELYGKEGFVYGEAWGYKFETPSSGITLYVCVYKGQAVSYLKNFFSETSEGLAMEGSITALDRTLVKNLIKAAPENQENFKEN